MWLIVCHGQQVMIAQCNANNACGHWASVGTLACTCNQHVAIFACFTSATTQSVTAVAVAVTTGLLLVDECVLLSSCVLVQETMVQLCWTTSGQLITSGSSL